MSAPYDASTVANQFIKLANDQERKLTPMQLIKLAYIAHGFSLALFRRALVAESVEAWRYGPVIPSLYRKLKQYGSGKVDQPISPHFMALKPEKLDEEDEELIAEVFAKYGNLSGTQLSYLTHRTGTPWADNYVPDEYGTEIEDSQIRAHYTGLLKN